MTIGLIDVDSHNFLNLALMKQLQRWANNRFVFAKCKTFEEYHAM